MLAFFLLFRELRFRKPCAPSSPNVNPLKPYPSLRTSWCSIRKYATVHEKSDLKVFLRSDLHFILTQIFVNIFRSDFFFNKEDTVAFVGRIARKKNIYENLGESEMKVR